jgi:chromosome segregation ATPase
VASLTGIFKAVPAPEPEQEQDTDKLLDLFRNRAELKKEFAALREEKYSLQDRVKEHRGAIERVQQKLNHLEALLLDPEWVHNVVVFYQLRRLAAHCETRVARFAEQLKQQREQRVYDKALAAWNERRDQQSAAVESRIGEHRLQLQLLEDRLQAERHKVATMGGLTRMLRGKDAEGAVAELEAELAAARAREEELLAQLEGIEKLEPPPHEGLDVGAKRSINCMLLSYVQQLYLLYEEDDLASLAKDASDKSVGAVNYGSKTDCDEILERLTERRAAVEQVEERADMLKHRARLIAERAVFRRNDDTVPAPASVETLFEISPNGKVTHRDRNLLGENYFGVAKVLSR